MPSHLTAIQVQGPDSLGRQRYLPRGLATHGASLSLITAVLLADVNLTRAEESAGLVKAAGGEPAVLAWQEALEPQLPRDRLRLSTW